MQQLLNLWNVLDTRKRAIIIGSAVVMFLGVLSLSRMAATPQMSLLFSGLSPSSAGEVIAALEADGVAFDVKGGAIFVDAARRDQLRLTLAGSGLPANSGDGYELLDTLSGFGTTSKMFDAAYLRAKEGELARTIIANPQIKAARVHIAQSNNGPFREKLPTTASVSLRGNGNTISEPTANAIRFLVASAVAGLQPENVSVINADLGVVMLQNGNLTPARTALNHGERLKQNVERLITARTGIGEAVVEVNVDTLSEEEILIERKLDPNSRVAISTNTQETNNSSRNQNASGVTVASNLPDGDAAEGGEESSNQSSDTREIINYEVSESTLERKRSAGSIKRVTVAVLVSGTKVVDAATGQEQFQPRSEEELAALEELVKSAVGYDEGRGDSVTIKSMDLQPDPALAQTSENGWVSSQPWDVMALAKLGTTAVVVLALGLFVIRPILLGAQSTAALPAPDKLLAGPDGLTGEIADSPSLPAVKALPDQTGAPSAQNAPAAQAEDDPVDRLKSLIESRQDETVEVLKSWIETPEALSE